MYSNTGLTDAGRLDVVNKFRSIIFCYASIFLQSCDTKYFKYVGVWSVAATLIM